MEVSDILSEDMILADINADSKRQLLEQLSTMVADKCDLDKNAVFEAILERENLGSTGYGNGVGYDHLQTLALLSRALKNEKTRQTIRQAKNAHEIYVALQK